MSLAYLKVLLLKILTAGKYRESVMIRIGFKSGDMIHGRFYKLDVTSRGNDLTGMSYHPVDGRVLFIRLDDVSFVVQE